MVTIVTPGLETMDLPTQLRIQTAEAHRRVEHLLATGRWFHNLKDYGLLLARLHVLHRHIETSMVPISKQFLTLDLTGRNRTALITADMASLDVALPLGLDIVPLPIRTASDALGALYVTEGSTLGGPTIARLLRCRLGLTSATGASSFHPYGADTADRWTSFCDFLCAWPGDQRSVIEAAGATFRCYEAWVLGPQQHSEALGKHS
jgi:heme oxygenase (biliverdin-IX-beta and delta-forming)